MTSPWLVQHPDIETDNVAQFVLASVVASNERNVTSSSPKDAAMHHHPDSAARTHNNNSRHPHDLYLKSAAFGNAFALTKLGSLSQEKELSFERAKQGLAILGSLRSDEDSLIDEQVVNSDGSISFDALAHKFWLEGAVRGNPLAQAYLADDMMERAVSSDNDDMRVLAAVLFGLSAQQGNDMASESLSRVVEFEAAHKSIQSQEEFESSPVVRTADAALQ